MPDFLCGSANSPVLGKRFPCYVSVDKKARSNSFLFFFFFSPQHEVSAAKIQFVLAMFGRY